jgi:hypothetical protein
MWKDYFFGAVAKHTMTEKREGQRVNPEIYESPPHSYAISDADIGSQKDR